MDINGYNSYGGFRCVACNIAFGSFDDQKQHYFAFHSRNVNPAPVYANPYMSPYQRAPKPKVTKPPLPTVKCGICNISCSSGVVFDFHIKGKKHAKAINKIALVAKGNHQTNSSVLKPETTVTAAIAAAIATDPQKPQVLFTADVMCKDCNVNCLTMEQFQKHLGGAKHSRVLKMNRYSEMVAKKDPSVYCEICDLFLQMDLMTLHRSSGKHKRKCNEKAPNEPVGKKKKLDNEVKTTVEHCGYCLVDFARSSEAVQHYQSLKHAISSDKNSSWCERCEKRFHSSQLLEIHLKGFKHFVRLNQGNPNPEGEMGVKLLKLREKMKGLKVKKQQNKKMMEEETVVDTEITTDDATDVTVESVTEYVAEEVPV